MEGASKRAMSDEELINRVLDTLMVSENVTPSVRYAHDLALQILLDFDEETVTIAQVLTEFENVGRKLTQIAESIRELDWQKAKNDKNCEWGEGCTLPVEHRCSRCLRFLCNAHTETRRVPSQDAPIFVHYCPECDVYTRARKRGE